MVRVLLEISGGNLQMAYCDEPVEVVLVDWDNIKADDECGAVGVEVEPMSAIADGVRRLVEVGLY